MVELATTKLYEILGQNRYVEASSITTSQTDTHPADATQTTCLLTAPAKGSWGIIAALP